MSHHRPELPAVAATVELLVQHHPSRAARAAQLVKALGGGTLVPDPEPDGIRSAWRTYRACLEYPTTASHIAILQDDTMPLVPRLPELLPRLASPSQITSLFVAAVPIRAARAVHAASDRGECWADLPRGDWTPAIALIWPRHLAERFVAWIDDRPKLRLRSDDGLIGAWLKDDRSVPLVRCSVPNLVEHPDDVASIAGKKTTPRAGQNPRRVSTCLPVAGCDPHAVDWG
jgi:hypothetical protein